jgi:hypothetical protein
MNAGLGDGRGLFQNRGLTTRHILRKSNHKESEGPRPCTPVAGSSHREPGTRQLASLLNRYPTPLTVSM